MVRIESQRVLRLMVFLVALPWGAALHADPAAPATDAPQPTRKVTPAPGDTPDTPDTPNAQDAQEADAPLSPTADQPSSADAPPQTDASVVGWLELSGALRTGPVPYAWVSSADAGPSLRDVLTQLRHVARGDQYLGLVIYLDWPELSLTQIDAIRREIGQVRAAGKRVLVFSESYDLKSYLLASAADLILLQHKGDVTLAGLSVEEMYLAGLLELVGAEADLLQIGQFKGAREPLTREGPSAAWSSNMDALLDDLYAQVIGPIARDRGITRDQVEAIMKDSWSMTDRDYLERGLIDRLVDRDLTAVTEVQFGTDFTWDDTMGVRAGVGATVDSPFAFFRMLFEKPMTATSRATIAVIHARGAIHSGDSQHGGGLLGADTIGSRTLVKALGKARDDGHIKGVVIQIDSPGGSALASEVIWQAVRELAETKPVYAGVGSMAASGGYYIACGADRIYVAPASIVGSIGVVGGKIVLGGLYEKLGIHVTRRSRGPLSDMFNSVEPFTDPQRKAVRSALERVYDQFIDRVSIGRGTRLQDVGAVAEGRLFTGRQAVANGMADRIGAIDDAVTAMADELGLEAGTYDVIHLPPPMSLSEFLGGVLSVRSGAVNVQASPAIRAAKRLLGPAAWASVRTSLSGLMQLRHEPVLLMMPRVIVIR